MTIVLTGLLGAATAAALFNPVPVARFNSAPPPTANPRSTQTLTATVISMEDKGRNVFVLNVTSRRTDAVIKNCQWRQFAGVDLHLNEVHLQRLKFGLRIREPGVYVFEVAVTYSDGVQERAQVALPVVEAVLLAADPNYMVYGTPWTELLTRDNTGYPEFPPSFATRVSISFQNVSLNEAMQLLQQQFRTNLTYRLDAPPRQQIESLSVENMELELLLRWMAKHAGVEVCFDRMIVFY